MLYCTVVYYSVLHIYTIMIILYCMPRLLYCNHIALHTCTILYYTALHCTLMLHLTCTALHTRNVLQ